MFDAVAAIAENNAASKPMVALALVLALTLTLARARAHDLAVRAGKKKKREKERGRDIEREREREREIRDGCALCQFTVVLSLENQSLIAGFAINVRRYPNADPAIVKEKNQATLLFLDPEHLLQPVHAVKVPLNMLDRSWIAKIWHPAANVNAK